jgi:hypothetical protein
VKVEGNKWWWKAMATLLEEDWDANLRIPFWYSKV